MSHLRHQGASSRARGETLQRRADVNRLRVSGSKQLCRVRVQG